METADNSTCRLILNFSDAIEGLDNDAELFTDLLNSFFGNDGFCKEKLHNLIDSGSLEEAARYAHLHKGTTGMLGAEQLFDALNIVDKIIRGKMSGSLSEAVNNLDKIYDETSIALKAKSKELSQ